MAEPDIFKTNIVGPIRSRRLGVSLGVNLLPADGKVCTFDCVYCECGWNADHRGGHFPSGELVLAQLRHKLEAMHAAGDRLDTLTFAGNGEPTLHPDFEAVVRGVVALRDEFYPDAKLSVLSNATRIDDPSVRRALLMVDNNILKLDSAVDSTARLVNRPTTGAYSVRHVVEGLKGFGGRLTVQTMFVRGEHDGQTIDNTTPREVEAWIDAVRQVRPACVMVYSLDRPTPARRLQKVGRDELERIAAPLVAEGFNVQVTG